MDNLPSTYLLSVHPVTCFHISLVLYHSLEDTAWVPVVFILVLQTSGIDDCVSGSPFQLNPTDHIRFLPTADVSKRNGSASFNYRVWDGTGDPCLSSDTGMHAHVLNVPVKYCNANY